MLNAIASQMISLDADALLICAPYPRVGSVSTILNQLTVLGTGHTQRKSPWLRTKIAVSLDARLLTAAMRVCFRSVDCIGTDLRVVVRDVGKDTF